jgi:hypothetical protein
VTLRFNVAIAVGLSGARKKSDELTIATFRQGHLFPPFGRISVFCLLGSNFLLRPIELGPVDPHAMQNECELARDRDLGLAEPITLDELHPPGLPGGPFRDAMNCKS